MYGKVQESGLTEIIPFIGTSAIWGQDPVFSHPEFPQGSPAHVGGLQSLTTVTSFVYWYGRQYSISHSPELFGFKVGLSYLLGNCHSQYLWEVSVSF